MENTPDLKSEAYTGDQSERYRKRRGRFRYPSWKQVQKWRDRWTPEKVTIVLSFLGQGAPWEEIGAATGFGTLGDKETGSAVADLRGLDLALLPHVDRKIDFVDSRSLKNLDLSRARLEGARLTGLNLSYVNLTRARFQKATLRRVNFTGATLTKAHLEDADMRDTVLKQARLGHIRYSEDGFWWRGTVLMEARFEDALYVDPLLERCVKDQYYLYVLKYRNRKSLVFRFFFFLWWILCNYGKSPLIWALWSVFFAIGFAAVYYQLGQNAFALSNLSWEFSTMLYYSVVTFTTLGFGDVTPISPVAAWWVMAEVITGYVMLGGLISIFATKLARRS